jgi:uncharacterized protein (DUF1778 family)
MRKTTKLKPKSAGPTLMVRLDAESKSLMTEAAELRRMSLSDYVRSIMVDQARREIAAAAQGVIVMSADEQLAFWNALQEPPTLTPAQQRLAASMKGRR